MLTITVIVPVYKVEPYLHHCVDSILAQTFADFELILVDDGSPDGCGAICDEYMLKDSRILVIHQPNGGLSAARNTGIDWVFACSDSKWLAFVDSDDWVHPRYLEYLYQAVKENNVQISVCDYLETDSPCHADSFMTLCSSVVDGIDFFASDKNVVATVAWNKLYGKEVFTDIRYPVGKIHEDEYTTYKLLYRAGDVVYVKEQLYYYFINPNGITKKGYSLQRLDAVEALEDQCQFFKKANKREHYEKWVIDLVLSQYPYHIRMLKETGETKLAECLRKHGGRFVFNNLRGIKKLNTVQKDDIFSFYYPRLNRLVMPICNLFRMLSRGGIREAVRYYRRKIDK